jgi:hypothetical protein
LISWIVAVSAFSAGPTAAQQFDETGVWTLQSMVFMDEGSGAKTFRFGEHPKGYLMFAPAHQMAVVINAEGRQPIPADSDKATELRSKLLMSMTAHAGPYQLIANKLVHQVEVAHDPKMVGKDLIRYIKVLDDDHMESTTPVMELGDGKRTTIVLTWQRVR